MKPHLMPCLGDEHVDSESSGKSQRQSWHMQLLAKIESLQTEAQDGEETRKHEATAACPDRSGWGANSRKDMLSRLSQPPASESCPPSPTWQAKRH